jgi:hypothetical protein
LGNIYSLGNESVSVTFIREATRGRGEAFAMRA